MDLSWQRKLNWKWTLVLYNSVAHLNTISSLVVVFVNTKISNHKVEFVNPGVVGTGSGCLTRWGYWVPCCWNWDRNSRGDSNVEFRKKNYIHKYNVLLYYHGLFTKYIGLTFWTIIVLLILPHSASLLLLVPPFCIHHYFGHIFFSLFFLKRYVCACVCVCVNIASSVSHTSM